MEKSIRLATEEVRGFLDGRKTMIRRIIPEKVIEKYSDYDDYCNAVMPRDIPCMRTYEKSFYEERAPYAKGDILWVRETWQYVAGENDIEYCYLADMEHDGVIYVDLDDDPIKWRPSIHMPRSAARLLLRVKDRRVERLQDITEEDAKSEGIGSKELEVIAYSGREEFNKLMDEPIEIEQFRILWDSTIKKQDLEKYGWNANPWVSVIESERVKGA